ncbi:GntR family transcriptional regulator [Nocardioides humi]|uniref:GntR family transcriptional regulator n=1 Tax=Nocardioides humi TaxID=449461 RepID=A0ABN2B622_9ACTN
MRHKKASEWVLSHLRDSILAGRLKPGEPLPLVQLANEVGLSTTPVREALGRLQDEGLVVGDARRTFRVAELTLDDITDYYLLHAQFSGILAERAARSLSESDVSYLRTLDQEMREKSDAGDFAALHELNYEFHKRINSLAAGVLKRFVTVTSRLVTRRTYPDVPGYTHSIDDHNAIIEAIAAHDGEKARTLMEDHIKHVGEAVIDDLRERGWK